MTEDFSNEPMLDMYLFETAQNIDNLEKCILETERTSSYTSETVNEIFRNMHTIKGSSAMMLFNSISIPAHSMEDLFYFIRENNPQNVNCSDLSDLILEGIDFIKLELEKIKETRNADGDPEAIIEEIKAFLAILKEQNSPQAEAAKSVPSEPQQYYITPAKADENQNANSYKAVLLFEDDCMMENVRAFSIVHSLKDIAAEICHIPNDIIGDESSINVIREEGFIIFCKADKSFSEMNEFFQQVLFLKSYELTILEEDGDCQPPAKPNQIILEEAPIIIPKLIMAEEKEIHKEQTLQSGVAQSMISVNVAKLDKLMDLVGEMIIAEAMVTQNPDLYGMEIENFFKASRQLHKINNEVRDMVMSIRMVPVSAAFQKMQRIVRDMSKKLDKEVHLHLVGEETEIDKNIIEHISDPLMHLVRNSIDHGIESAEQREAAEKTAAGNVTLEARNAGNDVIIVVRDDGKGLNCKKILEKAKQNNILKKPEAEMTEKEIYSLILQPGFSTNENVTEYSGRGVGMDVVVKNIEAVGGSVSIESIEGQGSAFILKIPLTLAIIDGMNIRVGSSKYTIPIIAIKESFRPLEDDIIRDHEGKELIMVRGQCYPILRLHKHYRVKTEITELTKGILIMIEQDEKVVCIFADELLGQQQVVVKSLPTYIKSMKKIEGLSGCTLLADGSTSLIFDVAGLIAIRD